MKKVITIVTTIIIILMVLLPTVALAADGTEGGDLDIWTYIVDEVLVLIPALYLIGFVIKKIPNIPDWIIPIVLMVLAVPAAMAITGWSVNGAIQGILVAGAAVLTNQVYKQVSTQQKIE